MYEILYMTLRIKASLRLVRVFLMLQSLVMSWYHPKTLLDKVFEAGLIIKGADGALEFLGGLLLLFVSPSSIHRFLAFITQQELTENPHDKFAQLVLHSADSLNTANKNFLILFLWIHAAVKLVSVIGILRNILWVYPFALVSLGLLMLYQVYSIYQRASLGLVLLTAFDIFVLVMIWKEYGKVKVAHLSP
jgi:uncharacterized membrane protein